MPVTIVVGGQYGSEGKGKVVALLARSRHVSCVVRCGGPNSGHTTSIDGRDVVLRQLPSSVGISDSLVAISAGAVIDEDILEKEVEEFKVDRTRLVIDPRAAVVTHEDKLNEQALIDSIGSTASGNGQALVRRILRDKVCLAENSKRLEHLARIEPVAPLLHNLIEQERHVVIEGTQGFGLSLLHGAHYPKVTSKDTTASSFAMEVGISPRDVDEIVLVIRTFPIRVAGDSGPLKNEITWEQIQGESGALYLEPEFTSVTKKLRRVGRFDLDLVRSAVNYNKPTSLAVMGLDRLDLRNRKIGSIAELSDFGQQFLSMLRSELGVPVAWVGTGFGTFDAISTKKEFVGEAVNVK